LVPAQGAAVLPGVFQHQGAEVLQAGVHEVPLPEVLAAAAVEEEVHLAGSLNTEMIETLINVE